LIRGTYDWQFGARIRIGLFLPSLSRVSYAIFVVDSGASHSSIALKSLEELGVDTASLNLRREPGEVVGVGGSTRRESLVAGLASDHLDGSVSMLRLRLNVLADAPLELPSLLGRDVLALGRVVLDPTSQMVTFDLPPGSHDLLR
jgi:hypothetical protein